MHCRFRPAASSRVVLRHVRQMVSSGGVWLDRLIYRPLTKKIRISRSAAADLCGDVLDWTRDSWWFRAWPGLYA